VNGALRAGAAIGLLALLLAGFASVPGPAAQVRPAALPRPASPPLPAVAAPAFAVSADGALLAARAPSTLRPTASTIKVLTALAVLEDGPPLDSAIVVTPAEAQAARAGLALGHGELPLRAGEVLTVRDLLLAMLLPSADDAADLLGASFPGGESGLLQQMRRIAGTLRLDLPPLGDPSGLSAQDRLSPLGELRLGAAAIRNRTLAAMVRRQTATLSQGDVVHSLNRLLGSYPGAIGVKTGQTGPAGYVLLFAARRATTVIGVVMGEPTDQERFQDARRLLDWAFARSRVRRLPAGSRCGVVVWPGGVRQVLRTRAVLPLPAGSAQPRLRLASPARLAQGGIVGSLGGPGRETPVAASPLPLWLRLWQDAAAWRDALLGRADQRP